MRRWILGALAIALTVASTGCSMHGLIFHDDHTIDVVTPNSNSDVTLPFTLTWQLKNGTAEPAAWAVLVDRTPPAPGKALPEDRTGIRVTHATDLVLRTITPHTSGTREERNRHEIVIVMLDAAGHRTSELSGYVEFKVET
jgi:hypothetical protein